MPSGARKRKQAKKGILKEGLSSREDHADLRIVAEQNTDKNIEFQDNQDDEYLTPKTPPRGSNLDEKSKAALQTDDWIRISDPDTGTPALPNAEPQLAFGAKAEEDKGLPAGKKSLRDWETTWLEDIVFVNIVETQRDLEKRHQKELVLLPYNMKQVDDNQRTQDRQCSNLVSGAVGSGNEPDFAQQYEMVNTQMDATMKGLLPVAVESPTSKLETERAPPITEVFKEAAFEECIEGTVGRQDMKDEKANCGTKMDSVFVELMDGGFHRADRESRMRNDQEVVIRIVPGFVEEVGNAISKDEAALLDSPTDSGDRKDMQMKQEGFNTGFSIGVEETIACSAKNAAYSGMMSLNWSTELQSNAHMENLQVACCPPDKNTIAPANKVVNGIFVRNQDAVPPWGGCCGIIDWLRG